MRVFNPNGGDMGRPAPEDQELGIDFGFLNLEAISKANNNQPTNWCIILPPGVDVFTVGDQVSFRLYEQGDREFHPTGVKIMYFTFDPKQQEQDLSRRSYINPQD